MYLYKRGYKNHNIFVYSFYPNKDDLVKLKMMYLNDVKSVKLHINNEETGNKVLHKEPVLFRELDREELDGEVSYIQNTNNKTLIYNYMMGFYDIIDPMDITGDVPFKASSYSGDINNEDSCFLPLMYKGNDASGYDVCKSAEGVLLTGMLNVYQPLLSNNIRNVRHPEDYQYLDSEIIDFLQIFNCDSVNPISYDKLRFLEDKNLISFNEEFHEAITKSEIILDSYNQVKKLKKIR